MTPPDKPRRRPISDEEQVLWQAVARTVSPLRRKRVKLGQLADDAGAAHSKPDTTPHKASAAKPPVQPLPRSGVTLPRGETQQPALAPLGRRDKQRLARGTAEIDARLDLHGRSQSQAHAALLRFLRQAQTDGAKTVLVITGKGGAADGERGVLKRQVPLWLSLPEFRALVVGFSAATIGHGGEGALYVRIRRAKG